MVNWKKHNFDLEQTGIFNGNYAAIQMRMLLKRYRG